MYVTHLENLTLSAFAVTTKQSKTVKIFDEQGEFCYEQANK
jgi:hypothetical protein